MNYKLGIFVLLLASSQGIAAEDWPQFKGDAARTGNRTEEILRLPMRRILALKFPAPIYASPVVVGGKVFVQDAHGNIACVDVNAGNKVVWTARIDGRANHSSPAVTGGKVFVGSNAGYLAVLDAKNGRVLKKIKTLGGVITSPAVTATAIYFVSTGGQLYKIDFNGKLLWSMKAARAFHVGIAVRGDKIIALSDSVLLIQDLGSSGKIIKKVPRMLSATGAPVFPNDEVAVFQGFDSESGALQKVTLGASKRAGTRLINDFNDSRVTPSFRAGILYRGDKATPLINAAGRRGNRKAFWQANSEALKPGGFHSSPALSKNHLVLGAEDGRVYFFALAKPGKTTPSKAVWIFNTEGVKQDVNRAVSSSPAISGGRVFFGGEDGILYGLGAGKPARIMNLPILDKTKVARSTKPAYDKMGPDWPTAGGDMGFSGVSNDQTIRPPFKVKWKTRIWSSNKSPVVVAAGKVFVSSRMGQLTTLDAESGEILWRTHHAHGEGRGAATYIEGKVLALRGAIDQNNKKNSNVGIWCHDARTGKLLWRKKTPLGYHFNADGIAAYKGKAFVCWNAGGGVLQAAAYALDNGRVIWERRFPGMAPTNKPVPVRHACAVGDGRVYFAIAASETLSRKKAKGKFGTTLAVHPDTGQLLWKNNDYNLIRGMRMSFRKGIVAVFSPDGTHALDAATGKKRWDSKPPLRLYYGHYYWQPLTDIFLNSKGQQGVCGYMGCSSPVYVGGLWYGHAKKSGPELVAFKEKPSSKKGVFTEQVVWRYQFISRACPSIAPAYGRIYYSPNGEGVVYCFEPTGGK